MSADSQVQPTITEGPLTAIKKTETGMPVFQTQAPPASGNSGGPVLDDAGNVVGILVASAVADDGTALEGQEFVIPISVVRQMLNETNVKPGESATTQAYNVALGAYHFDKYYKRAAMPEFQRVQALYPSTPWRNTSPGRSRRSTPAGTRPQTFPDALGRSRRGRPHGPRCGRGGRFPCSCASAAGPGARLLARRRRVAPAGLLRDRRVTRGNPGTPGNPGSAGGMPGSPASRPAALRASCRSTRISNRPPPARMVSPLGLPSRSSRPSHPPQPPVTQPLQTAAPIGPPPPPLPGTRRVGSWSAATPVQPPPVPDGPPPGPRALPAPWGQRRLVVRATPASYGRAVTSTPAEPS